MCPSPRASASSIAVPETLGPSIETCFTCTRLNPSTFRIVEDDKWYEMPFIYAKVFEKVIVLVDTGCGGAARDSNATLTSLRTFLETYPVPDNEHKPLNPGGEKVYSIVCTHCHYDHIGGIGDFANLPGTRIWASSYDRDFIEGVGSLPTNSLCALVGMKTPQYRVTDWVTDGQCMVHNGQDLGLTVYHTPGHTPDELALWDEVERVLYVGDTMYEWAHIFFPKEGNLIDYSNTLGKLEMLVRQWNLEHAHRKVRIACGHITDNIEGDVFLAEVDATFYECIKESLEPRRDERSRDEPVISFMQKDGRVSFMGPERLFADFRKDSLALEALEKRHQ